MSITVRKFDAQVRDTNTGEMIPAGLLSSDALGAINTAKTNAVAAVQAKGVETINSIPDDYTELSDEVDNLKIQFNEEFTENISPNLLNPDGFITGKRINSQGIFYSTSNAHTSNIINVEDASSLAIYCPISSGITQDYYSFGTDDSFSNVSTVVDHGLLTFKHEVVTLAVPEGAKYFVFGFGSNNYYDYVKALTSPVANIQIGTSITDWRPYGEVSRYLTDLVQEPGIDNHAPISQKGVTDNFVQKMDIVENTGNNTDKVLSQKAVSSELTARIASGNIMLDANANIDDPNSDYYAYRDFNNFPVNSVIRLQNNARVRPRLTIQGGSHIYQDAIFIGNAAARAAYVGQTVTVTSDGVEVTGVVDAESTWLNCALDHAPISGYTYGPYENTMARGIYAAVMTYATATTGTKFIVQMCVDYASTRTPYISTRLYNSSGTWTAWNSLSSRGVLHSTNDVVAIDTYDKITFEDFNDAPPNTIYQVDLNCGSTVKHNPAPGKSGLLITYSFSVSSRHALVQNHYALESGRLVLYYRYGWQNTPSQYAWTPWEKPSTTSVYTAAANVPKVSDDIPGIALASPSAGESGTEITLTATAKSGYMFDHWEVISGGVTINDNKFILGSANAEVNAIFVAN